MTIITASEDQIKKIFKKHLRWVFWISYSYDMDDSTGFISCYNIYGSWIQFMWQYDKPRHFSLTNGDIRYDIYELKGEMLERVIKIGKIAARRFWKGGQL